MSLFTVQLHGASSFESVSFNTQTSGAFIENKGQLTDMDGEPANNVLFVAQFDQLNVFITTTGITFLFQQSGQNTLNIDRRFYNWQRVDLELKGAIISPDKITKELEGRCEYRYFTRGNPDPVIVKDYKRILISNIYPGIDWEILYTEKSGFKYNFIVSPYADISQIQLVYHSDIPINLSQSGEMSIKGSTGELKENSPYSYLKETGNEVQTSFQQVSTGLTETIFKYRVNEYDLSQTLVIDPELYWATYFGGMMEECFNSVTTDIYGDLILVGWTDSPNFPTWTAGTFFQGTKGTDEDAMIVKFSPDEELLWATFYGGNHEDWAYSVTTDESGNIFVSGETVSGNFPVYNAGTFYQGTLHGDEDVFILKFDNDGNRLWATYYGGDKKEGGHSITHDASGNIFVTGYTESTDFPKLNAGTFYQSTMGGVQDAFILKFSNDGTRLWATYYGGNSYDAGNSITNDAAGNIFITGDTRSTTFPVFDAGTYYQSAMAGDTDLFILKFSNTGSRLWATYFGGDSSDYGHSIITNLDDHIYIGGWTKSIDMPTLDMGNYYQGSNAGDYDGLLLRFDNDGSLMMSTYYGGTGKEDLVKWDALSCDMCNNIYFALTSFSTDMPVYDAGCGSYFDNNYEGIGDIFISRFTTDNLITWATYYGYDNEELNACIGVSQLVGHSLYMTGQYNEYDPGAPVPLVDPGGVAYYDGTHNNDDEAFISKFIPVPLSITTTNSMICDCTDTATVFPSCGVAPYTYFWNDGQTTQTAIDLCEGTYEVIVTDADCNIDTATVIIICALPVELINFSAVYSGHAVELKWTTASELNADYFTISRSVGGGEFIPIATVNAHGTTSEMNEYLLRDPDPGAGIIYYQLTETSLDGITSDKGTVSISITDNIHVIHAYMISQELMQINFNSTIDGIYQIQLIHAGGEELYRSSWQVEEGINTTVLDIGDLPDGVYIILLSGNNEKLNAKFIK